MAEAKEIFEAESRSLQEVLGATGTGFYIPAFQRTYSWEKKKVERLLSDLMLGFEQLSSDDKVFSFLGTVILIHDINYTTIDPVVKPDVPGQVLNVIDGQQRLSTLIALCIALHAEIAIRWSSIESTLSEDATGAWLTNQTEDALGQLDSCIRFEKVSGQGKTYPRMIRAFEDQWAKANPKYASPIASLISQYISFTDGGSKSRFSPSSGESRELFQRFGDLQKYVKRVATSRAFEDDWDESSDPRPHPAAIANSSILQRELTKFALSPDEQEVFGSEGDIAKRELAVLVLYALFVLKRVAVTTVTGKNEDYAFEVFESLNTTGEPLTAFETFKPRVVRAETLAAYGDSEAKGCIDRIDSWLNSHPAAKRPALTRDLITMFALVEDGRKEPLNLTAQRKYLQKSFEQAQAEARSLTFLKDLRDVAVFNDKVWDATSAAVPVFERTTGAVPDDLSFCIRSLIFMNHSIAAAPIIKYYADAAQSEETLDKVRAIALSALSFSVLWRAALGSTSGIDSAYRDLMRGTVGHDSPTPSYPGLARTKTEVQPSIDATKDELVRLLWNKLSGGQPLPTSPNRRVILEDWIRPLWTSRAIEVDIYKHSSILKLLLLAAHEDSVPDGSTGLIKREAKADSIQRMTPAGLTKYSQWSIEHIAPQHPDGSIDWDSTIYDSPTTVHTIGNLVLLPVPDNSMLSNKSWHAKAILYQALGQNDTAEAKRLLDESKLSLTQSALDIAAKSSYVPELQAIGALGKAGEQWSLAVIQHRASRLLDLSWDKYSQWLA